MDLTPEEIKIFEESMPGWHELRRVFRQAMAKLTEREKEAVDKMYGHKRPLKVVDYIRRGQEQSWN